MRSQNPYARQIVGLGCKTSVVKADLSDSSEAEELVPLINKSTLLHALINGAVIFESRTLETTSLDDGHKHIQINLTAPFLLGQKLHAKQTDLRVHSIYNSEIIYV